ncbi:DUF1559 family PulG-like putative transporter [Stieleria varia]|uniref:DUF1559 domain-containing protein n=1 Tax=Stieleria varia TaxID=2528005 RepID=A0A5C5ZXJ5_9BACT|nr:DUF1559 domain-containing protein [Stieleria varia]TWT92364.1 hypothetical protein Pla52n_62380 [Stieleria varia]
MSRVSKYRSASGFTLIELLVVIAIIALLAALLVGAVVKARESARSSLCRANLKNVGIGFATHVIRSPGGEFCSGLFDHNREGCMDRYGWVADQINAGSAQPETLLCPSNPIRVNEKLLDAYGIGTNDNLNDLTGSLRSRWTKGMCGKVDWNGLSGTGDPDEGFASTDPVTEERRALVSRYFVEQGFNTNYATSWFLTYTAPRVAFRSSDGSIRTNGQAAQQGLRGKRETLGPLTDAYLTRSDVPSSQVALLGDAAPGDLDEAVSPIAFSYGPDDAFARDNSSRVFTPEGSLLSESALEGPTFYHRSQKIIKRIGSNGSRLEFQWECDSLKNCEPPTGSSGNNMYMQSTLGWMATHQGSGGYSLNMLFADGSVRGFTDGNGDLFLNPGFPIPDDLTESQYDTIGYRDSTPELGKGDFFSGVFLAPSTLKGYFE